MENPLVSIIIPVYNRASIVGITLDSIISQTYKDWECIIVDDGSTDNTYDTLIRYQQKDARIKPYRKPLNKKKGGNACRNYGLKKSKGALIVWFDSDDIMQQSYLSFQVKALKGDKYNYSICKSIWHTMTGRVKNGFRSLQIKSDDPINDYIQFKIFWPINAVCYKRTFLSTNNLSFDEDLQQSQEYDFHVKVLKADNVYQIIDHNLITIISSPDSISYSRKNSFKKISSSLKVRMRLLRNSKELGLTFETKKFLLSNVHSTFQQQALKKNRIISIYTAYIYLLAHFTDKTLFKSYLFKHITPLVTVTITYNLFGLGYRLFKKSNTFI